MWPNSPVVLLWTDWKPCHSQSRQWHLTATTCLKVATQSFNQTYLWDSDKNYGHWQTLWKSWRQFHRCSWQLWLCLLRRGQREFKGLCRHFHWGHFGWGHFDLGHFDWGSSKGKLFAASGTVPHNDITTLLPIENDIAAFCIKLLSPVSAEPTSAALQLLGASICVVWLSENLASLKMLKDLDPIVNFKKAGKLQASFGVFPLLRLWHRHGWSGWPIRSQWLCLLCLRPPKKRCERPMLQIVENLPQHSLNPLTVSKPTAKLRGHIGASGSEVGDHLGQRLNKGCCLENVLRYVVSVKCGTDKYFLLRGFEMDMLLRKKSAPSRHSPVSLSCHCPHLEGAYKKAESNTCHIAVKKNEKDRKGRIHWSRSEAGANNVSSHLKAK